ncbi:hypothetical protein ACET3Z_019906 [Daucus carota]
MIHQWIAGLLVSGYGMTETNMISGVGQSGISSANGTMMPTPGMGQQGQYLNFFTVLVLASVPKPQFGLAGIMWVAFAESKQIY